MCPCDLSCSYGADFRRNSSQPGVGPLLPQGRFLLPSLDPGNLEALGSVFKERGEVGNGHKVQLRKRGCLPAMS